MPLALGATGSGRLGAASRSLWRLAWMSLWASLVVSRGRKILVKQGNLLSRELRGWLVFYLVPFTRQEIHDVDSNVQVFGRLL